MKIVQRLTLTFVLIFSTLLFFSSITKASTTVFDDYFSIDNIHLTGSDDLGKKEFVYGEKNEYTTFINNTVTIHFKTTKETDTVELYGNGDDFYSSIDGTNLVIREDDIEEAEIRGYSFQKFIKLNKVGTFTLIVSDVNDESIYDTLTINVIDEIKSIEILCDETYPVVGDKLTFTAVFNDNKELALVTGGKFEFSQSLTETKINNQSVKINTSGLGSTLSITYKQSFSGEEKSKTLDINFFEFERCEVIIAPDSVETFLSGSDVNYFYIYITKGSRPTLSLLDKTNTVNLTSYEIINDESDDLCRVYDKVKVNLETYDIHETYEILIGALCYYNDGDSISEKMVYKSKKISIISRIEEFSINTIAAEKVQIGDKVTFKASVNGINDFVANVDWYIDGEKYENFNDVTLVYTFNDGGNHSIHAMIGDVQTDSIDIYVRYTKIQMIIWYCVGALALIIGIPVLVILSKKKKVSKTSKYLEECKGIYESTRLLALKYSNKKTNVEKSEVRLNKLVIKISNIEGKILITAEECQEAVYDYIHKNIVKTKNILKTIKKVEKIKTIKERAELIKKANEFMEIAIKGLESIARHEELKKNKKKEDAK